MEETTLLDETDISREMKWFYEERARRVVNSLQNNNINAQYVPDREAALKSVLAMIPPGVVVARGDSISLDQIGVIPELQKRGLNKLIYPLERDTAGEYIFPEREQRYDVARETFSADIFLVGTNAITFDGKLVNIDGIGNRVAPMVFGPKKVIVVVGVNKIAKDVDEALERVRSVAAPMNAMRHFLKHQRPEFEDLPCVKTGRCIDCKHPSRICRYTVIIEGATIRDKGRINVVLVGEELGL